MRKEIDINIGIYIIMILDFSLYIVYFNLYNF